MSLVRRRMSDRRVLKLIAQWLGVIFGAASVYLGLKIGLTTTASIPIAVLAIGFSRGIRRTSILENNLIQTVGSAGESIAAAVVFTLPAMIFLGFEMEYAHTFTTHEW
jgi:putative OPT family oligopeptide transporter